MNKLQFDLRPDILQPYDSYGRYAIRFDIEQVTYPETDFQPERTGFECYQVIAQTNKRADLIIAIIREKYSVDDEFALHRKYVANETGAEDAFNEYNAFVNYAKEIVNNALGL